jgi:DnaJ-class molecular chaperone
MTFDKTPIEESNNYNSHVNDNDCYSLHFDKDVDEYARDDATASEISSSSTCAVCDGRGYIDSWRTVECYFCNGTGEFTKAASSFMNIHPCQCVNSDRKNCLLCKQKCHHSTENKPKVLVVKSPPP